MCDISFGIFPFFQTNRINPLEDDPWPFPVVCFFFALRPVGDKSHSTFGKPKGSYCDLDRTWGVGFPCWMDDGWLED